MALTAKQRAKRKINELTQDVVSATISLSAETNRANSNAKVAEHHAGVAKNMTDALTIERIGRRSLLESFRAERLGLVRDLFRVDQRIRVLLETTRGDHNALNSAGGQVENDFGAPLVGPRS